MLNLLKKIIKSLGSRLVYLFVGLSFAVVIITVQALTTTNVTPGTTLTAARWNGMVADLAYLDSRSDHLNARVSILEATPLCYCIQCKIDTGADVESCATFGNWTDWSGIHSWGTYYGTECRIRLYPC